MKPVYIKFISVLVLLSTSTSINAQEWMSNLEIAQKLALVQNKMVLMVWEQETLTDYPVTFSNTNNRAFLIEDLFSDPQMNKLIWDYFVPVVVPEIMFDDFYNKIKNKRSQLYLDKFSDASLKVVDANGVVVNVNMNLNDSFNISKIIEDYALNTTFLAQELRNYVNSKTFYSGYFLAERYLDFSMYHNKVSVRTDLLAVAKIYTKNTAELLLNEPEEKQPELLQRLKLLELQPDLLKGKSGKVLRNLKRIEKNEIFDSNQSYMAFFYYTVYKLKNDDASAEPWKSSVTARDQAKAQGIVNMNKY